MGIRVKVAGLTTSSSSSAGILVVVVVVLVVGMVGSDRAAGFGTAPAGETAEAGAAGGAVVEGWRRVEVGTRRRRCHAVGGSWGRGWQDVVGEVAERGHAGTRVGVASLAGVGVVARDGGRVGGIGDRVVATVLVLGDDGVGGEGALHA